MNLGALGGAAGTTVVVHVSGDHWADIASFAVALGTLAVAVATIRLARKTKNLAEQTENMAAEAKREADASFDQVKLTGAALNASTRPWLTLPRLDPLQRGPSDVDGNQPGIQTNGGLIRIALPLENVGSGLALIDPNGIKLYPHRKPDFSQPSWGGRCDYAVVPPGRIVQLKFVIEVRTASPPWNDIEDISGHKSDSVYGDFSAEVCYADAAGGQQTRALVKVARPDPQFQSWKVYEIGYFDGDAEQPSWVSRFMTPDEIDPAENVH
jgi:hypothetical protein